MLKTLKNRNGFGLIGLIAAMTIIIIMTAMVIPTFTAKMNYKQAKYTVGVIKTIENAENAYMAKNGSFTDLVTLSNQGYLSSNFLQSVQGGSYPQPNWVSAQIANQTVNICIDDSSGCPNNPGVGNNGYFLGIYNIPSNFQTYIEHELPGSGAVGTQDVSYIAPVPSSPPVANANYANSAGSANTANYANTAGFANSSGLPAWSQEANSLVGQNAPLNYNGLDGPGFINNTGNTLVAVRCELGTCGTSTYSPGEFIRGSYSCYYYGIGGCGWTGPFILSAFSG